MASGVHFAARFRRLLSVLGVSYQQLAAESGVSSGTLGRWYRAGGTQLKPQSSTIRTVAPFLGLTPEELCGRDEPQPRLSDREQALNRRRLGDKTTTQDRENGDPEDYRESHRGILQTGVAGGARGSALDESGQGESGQGESGQGESRTERKGAAEHATTDGDALGTHRERGVPGSATFANSPSAGLLCRPNPPKPPQSMTVTITLPGDVYDVFSLIGTLRRRGLEHVICDALAEVAATAASDAGVQNIVNLLSCVREAWYAEPPGQVQDERS